MKANDVVWYWHFNLFVCKYTKQYRISEMHVYHKWQDAYGCQLCVVLVVS